MCLLGTERTDTVLHVSEKTAAFIKRVKCPMLVEGPAVEELKSYCVFTHKVAEDKILYHTIEDLLEIWNGCVEQMLYHLVPIWLSRTPGMKYETRRWLDETILKCAADNMTAFSEAIKAEDVGNAICGSAALWLDALPQVFSTFRVTVTQALQGRKTVDPVTTLKVDQQYPSEDLSNVLKRLLNLSQIRSECRQSHLRHEENLSFGIKIVRETECSIMKRRAQKALTMYCREVFRVLYGHIQDDKSDDAYKHFNAFAEVLRAQA